MTDIKKLDSTLSTTSTISQKISKELTRIRKAAEETNAQAARDADAPYQTKESPYFPDREYSNVLAVQGTAEEIKWKEVPTYEDQRPQWTTEASAEPNQEVVVMINNKRLNII